jgi:DnaK suppressor protein
MIIISGGEMNATELAQNDLENLKESLLFQKSSILNKTHEFKEEQSNMSSAGVEHIVDIFSI